MTLPDGLLDAAKNYLDITWTTTPSDDAKLGGILLRGMAYLDKVAGATQDYSAEEQPRALLLDYARYARASALDEYAANYLPELLRLQIDAEIAAAKEGDSGDP